MVQWAPITGLSDSCSPPFWLHLHWERPATDGWPVEDFVTASSHTVISQDSLQETKVRCTQFEGLTVHGGILHQERGGCVLYQRLTIWDRNIGEVILSCFFLFCHFQILLSLSRRLSPLLFLSSFTLSLMSIRLRGVESGAVIWQQWYIAGYYFPRVLITILIVLLCRAPQLQSIYKGVH